jgi:predicted translin family RNA/ssDNA-binding protein
MSIHKKKDPQKLIDRWNILAERYDLLKEYLLRPIREAKRQAGTNLATLSPEDIKRNQVLPSALWRSMQDAYHKAERNIEALEKELWEHPDIMCDAHGTPQLKK